MSPLPQQLPTTIACAIPLCHVPGPAWLQVLMDDLHVGCVSPGLGTREVRAGHCQQMCTEVVRVAARGGFGSKGAEVALAPVASAALAICAEVPLMLDRCANVGLVGPAALLERPRDAGNLLHILCGGC